MSLARIHTALARQLADEIGRAAETAPARGAEQLRTFALAAHRSHPHHKKLAKVFHESTAIARALEDLRRNALQIPRDEQRAELERLRENIERQAYAIVALLEQQQGEGAAQAESPYRDAPATAAPASVVTCTELSKRYPGFTLNDVSLTVERNTIIGVVGANAAGKTTLLRMLAGDLLPTTGTMTFPSTPEVEPFARVQYVPQQPQRWYGTVWSHLLDAAALYHPHREAHEHVASVSERLNLQAYTQCSWHALSGGTRTRVAVARALVADPDLLVLDEPLAPMDARAQQWFLNFLASEVSSPHRGLAAIMSSHHIDELENVADEIVVIRDGHAEVFEGRSDIRARQQHAIFEVHTDDDGRMVLASLSENHPAFTVVQLERATIIYAPKDTTTAQIMAILMDSDITLFGFREITDSTRSFLLWQRFDSPSPS